MCTNGLRVSIDRAHVFSDLRCASFDRTSVSSDSSFIFRGLVSCSSDRRLEAFDLGVELGDQGFSLLESIHDQFVLVGKIHYTSSVLFRQ